MPSHSCSETATLSRPPQPLSTARATGSATMPSYALLLGNFVVGISVLAPAGMLKDLATGLGVSIGQAGLLVTFGAIVMSIGSPLLAWATSRIERRTLLGASLALVAAGQFVSAFAPNYLVLAVARIMMLAAASVFTPQAASTIALLVPDKERSRAIALIFLGWSLSVAGGLPLVTSLSAHLGWRDAYAALAAIAAVSFVFMALALPRGLYGAPVSFRSWGLVLRSRQILLILLVTVLSLAGELVVLTYLGPLLSRLAGAQPGTIALFFAGFGVTGFLGNVVATQTVGQLGAFRSSAVFVFAILLGLLLWSIGAGVIGIMAAGVLVWGLGFAAANSMQQARLAAAASALASATIALNTSSVYIGQTIGSAVGGLLIERGLLIAMGYVAAAFLVGALVSIALSRPRG